MIILDTNVVSEMMRPRPQPRVIAWLNSQDPDEVWMTAISVFEVEQGVFKLDSGRRRDAYRAKVDQIVHSQFRHRIVPLDRLSAALAAELLWERRRRGRAVEERDTFIAGIALANGATLATRNVRHFADLAIDVVNPWGPDDPGPDA